MAESQGSVKATPCSEDAPIINDDKLMSIIANDEKMSSMVKELKDTPLHDKLLKSGDIFKQFINRSIQKPPDKGKLICENQKLKLEKYLLETQIQLKNFNTAFANFKKRAKDEVMQIKENTQKEVNTLVKKMHLQREKFHEILENKLKEAEERNTVIMKEMYVIHTASAKRQPNTTSSLLKRRRLYADWI